MKVEYAPGLAVNWTDVEMARIAEIKTRSKRPGDHPHKSAAKIAAINQLIKDGFSPIEIMGIFEREEVTHYLKGNGKCR